MGYYFGISAASAENPDSFEVFKFVITTDSHTPDIKGGQQEQQQQQIDASGAGVGDIPAAMGDPDPADVEAASIRTSDAQFADLHNRLQVMMRHISALNRDLNHYMHASESKNEEISRQIAEIGPSLSSRFDLLITLGDRMSGIERDLKQIEEDTSGGFSRHVQDLKGAVRESHHTILGTMASSAPRIGLLVVVILGSQVLLVVAYAMYKRRKANGPKKYL